MITSPFYLRCAALIAFLVAVALFATAAIVASSPRTDVAAATSAVVDAEASVVVSTTASADEPVIELAAVKKKSIRVKFTPEKVVKVAKRYAGSRYAYGGSSPRGFDCSGFTKFIYAKFGVDLPHSAFAQGKEGKRVSRAKAKPGDLVIASGGSHVGIWVSKGKFIDAGRPGQGVHVRKIYTDNYFIVRVESETRKA